MLKASILMIIVAWGVQAYEVAYQTQQQVIEGPTQVIYEQGQPQVIYEQQPVYVQQPQVLVPQQPIYVQQPAVVQQNCPIACPYGWNKWGPLTKNCYLAPAQPMKPDSFWNQYRYCQSVEPTSYPFVINDLVEQALATGVALQYAPSYALAATNLHVWLGGYNINGRWYMADGTQPNPLLMVTVNLIGGRNGSCLSADPKTVGAWLPRPCSDDTGVVFCEMAPRPVCDGKTGGMLPISPIDLKNLALPKMPSIPIIGQPLGGGDLLGGLFKG